MSTFNLVGKLLDGENPESELLKQAKQQRTFQSGPVGVLSQVGPFAMPEAKPKSKSLADMVKEKLAGDAPPMDLKNYKPKSELEKLVLKKLHGYSDDVPKDFSQLDMMENLEYVQRMADYFPEMARRIMTDDKIVDKGKALSSLASDFSKRCQEKMASVKK